MKHLLSILLAFTLLFSCGADTKPAGTTNSAPAATAVNRAKPVPPRPVIISNTYDGQLVSLSRIYLTYNNNGNKKIDEVKTDLAIITHKDLTFVKDFIFELTQKSDKLLSQRFLQKPSKKDLEAIYTVRFINWNSMGLEPITEVVLDRMNLNSMTDTEVLTTYYRLIATALASNRNQTNTYSNINIDLDQLGLADKKEKGIVFYTLASTFARKYNSIAGTNAGDCGETKKLSFPTFNGKNLFEVKPPTHDDFNFIMSNNIPSISFKGHHEAVYKEARLHYTNCK